jgi:hypothetical protein
MGSVEFDSLSQTGCASLRSPMSPTIPGPCSVAGSLSGGANHHELAPMLGRSYRRCHSLFSVKVGVRPDMGAPQTDVGYAPCFFQNAWPAGGVGKLCGSRECGPRPKAPPPALGVGLGCDGGNSRFSLGRVEMWRGGGRSGISVCRLFRLAVPYCPDHGSVSTSPSSNRTCRFPASGSRTRSHAFAHACSRPLTLRRTSPKCPYRCESG